MEQRTNTLPLNDVKAAIKYTMDYAASFGYLEGVRYVVEEDKVFSNLAILCATTNGHLDVVIYLYGKMEYDILDKKILLQWASRFNRRNIVKWFCFQQGFIADWDTIVGTAQCGNFELTQWYLEHAFENQCIESQINVAHYGMEYIMQQFKTLYGSHKTQQCNNEDPALFLRVLNTHRSAFTVNQNTIL